MRVPSLGVLTHSNRTFAVASVPRNIKKDSSSNQIPFIDENVQSVWRTE